MSSDSLDMPETLALVGSPNSGKTTLFNWLTGSRAKTVNYAGSTVECHQGRSLPVYGDPLKILDTPGIYSLQPHGPDEEVTFKALTERQDVKSVIVVIDGTQLNRQLYLIRQILELKIPFIVALTMVDLVRGSGRTINVQRLSELIGAPVIEIDGRLGGGVKEVLACAREMARFNGTPRANGRVLDWDADRIEKEIAISEAWTNEVLQSTNKEKSFDRLRRWDQWFLHPVWGLVAFVVIMGALFSSIFWLAAPLMDLVDEIFSTASNFSFEALGQGWLADFVANGIISGVGAVLVFVPQIFILFVGLILLEDSGYLARAATIVDRPLQKIGLSGRSFVPILSGFACAVPAVMATRNIRSPRERWITVFILPFMTCSARLPVYALLLTFLFAGSASWKGGLAMAGLYIGGLISGGVAAGILNRIVRTSGGSHFLMELPFYRRPKMAFVLRQAARRTTSYVRKAGPTIFAFVMVLWVGTHFPHIDGATPTEQLEQSVIGRVGQVIEPVFTPMGLDWRAGLGMVSAFVAREVFVSSLAVIFSIADESEDSLRAGLLTKMREAVGPDGTPLFTIASVSALIIYFMLALQCLSTTGVTWREMSSWRFALVQLVTLNLAAYGAAVVVYQGLSALGFG